MKAAPTPADPSSFDDAADWAFADRMQDHLDREWDGTAYRPRRAMYNANMLLTHAAAALAGHTGPAGRDDRARSIIEALCTGAAWRKAPADGPQGHIPAGRTRCPGSRCSTSSWTPRSRGR